MDNLSVLKPSFFCPFFVLLHLITVATSDPSYNATDVIFLNCGSSDDGKAEDGRPWTGDAYSKFGPIEPSNKKSIAATAIIKQGSSVESIPYQTARVSRSRFTYIFPVTAGQKFIRLHFYPALYGQIGYDNFKDFFDVKVGPFTLLRNFSASFYATYGWGVDTFFKEFSVNVEENQHLNITFAPFFGDSNDTYAFINGIEIVSMPTNLLHTTPGDLGPKFIGQNRQFYVQNDTALETVCRLNIGGSLIPSWADTGMYRLWNDDTGYFWFFNLTTMPRYPDLSLHYSKIPPYTAPDKVYKSARSLGRNLTENINQNLKFVVPVDNGFMHLVRLHFCEIVPEITAVNDRRFSISIDSQEAEAGFDVFESSGGKGIPIYEDYIVMTGHKGITTDYQLAIILRPNASGQVNVILNGLEVFKLNDSDGNIAGPNTDPSVTPSPPPAPAPIQPPPPVKKSNTMKAILLFAVGGSVIGFLIILSMMCCFVIWRQRKRKHYDSYYESLTSYCSCLITNKGKSARTKASSLPEELCRQFSLAEIKDATENFHEKWIIGEGGFGKVYKGVIDDGAMLVAIKRLNPESKQGFKEFKTEIEMLSQLRHVHLVSLVGYCSDKGEMILVYEYMQNGTLQDHLYGTNNDPLPWKQRLEICIGGASGLDYLHAGATNTIIHRDVKTTNILLDEKLVAKVSDFGLSRIGLIDAAVSTCVKGTFGYLDPEYARREQLSDKSDVYSFGVVLFEVLCARKPVDRNLAVEQWNLANWARKCIQNKTIHEIIDPYLMGRIAPDCFNKFVEIAESCVRDQGNDRPTMHDVMEKLEFALQLQVTADAEKEQKNPGDEYFYPLVSFHVSPYTSVCGSEMDSSGASGFHSMDTSSTGMTSRSLDSGKHDSNSAA